MPGNPRLGWANVDHRQHCPGRQRHWDLYMEDPDFVVLADPDGNRFCVIDKGPR
jgi:hypothetical protein